MIVIAFASLQIIARPAGAAGVDQGWGTAAPLVIHQQGNAFAPVVAADSSGNAIVMWSQNMGNRETLWANQFTPLGGGRWAGPTELANGPYDTYGGADIAFDGSGNAMAVYTQWDSGSGYTIFARRYFSGCCWSQPTKIDNTAYSWAYLPYVAMNAGGTAFAVWTEWDGRWSIYANRFAGGAWGNEVRIETNAGGRDASTGDIAVDPSGNAMAIWTENDGIRDNVAVNRYIAGTGWAGPVLIDGTPYDAGGPHVALDGTGNGNAVWHQWDGSSWTIYAARFTTGGGWAPPVVIDSSSAFGSGWPAIATNPAGTMFAVWQQYDGSYNSEYANRFSGGAWAPSATLLETLPGDVGWQDVTVDTAGNAYAVWSQLLPTGKAYAARFNAGTSTWGPAGRLDSASGQPYETRAAIDGSGNAFAVWRQNDGTRDSIYADRYTGAWGGNVRVERDDAGSIRQLGLSVNANGQAVAAWTQDDGGIWNVYASAKEPYYGWWINSIPMELSSTGDAEQPRVAMSATGQGFVVFRQWDGSAWSIYANKMPSWSSNPTLLETRSGDAGDPQVGADSNGNAMAIWSQNDGTAFSIYTSYYSVSLGSWGPATLLDTLPWDAWWSSVQFDKNGNAIAIWYEFDGSSWTIFADRWVGGVWQGARALESSARDDSAPRLSVSPSGDAAAAWIEFDGAYNRIYGSHYSASTDSWGTPALLTAPISGDAINPWVATDYYGNAIVVFQQWSGSSWQIWAAWNYGTNWYGPQPLNYNPGDQSNPTIAETLNGHAVATWDQWDGTQYRIWSARWDPVQGWVGIAPVESGSMSAVDPIVGVDAGGQADVVYQQYDGERWLPWTNHFTVRDGSPLLTLFSPLEGAVTNNANFFVSGQTDPGLVVYVDGTPVTAGPYGNFGTVATLPEGVHTFFIYVSNAGQTTYAYRTVTVDLTPPSLTITSPTVTLTKDPNVYVAGRTEPGATVAVDGIRAAVDASGNFGLVDGLGEGTNVIPVTATDAAGNSVTRSVSITLDTNPPALALTSPTPGLTNNPSVTVAGTTEVGAVVRVDGTVTPVDGSGRFTRTVSLPDGAHTFDVTSADPAGNVNERFAAVTVDTAKPSLTLTSPTPNSITNSPIVTVTGYTEIGAQVTVNGVAVTPDVMGGFSVDLAMSDGQHTISVAARDAAGNVATASTTVIVDTKAPTLVVTAPATTLTNNPSVTVAGTTEPGATLTVDGTPVTVGPTGSFSTTVTLPEGAHTFDIVAVDGAGNIAKTSVTVTVDTTAPSVAITTPTTGLLTNNPVVSVYGSAEPGARVVVNGMAVDNPAGNWFTRLALAEGLNAIRADARDAAGNTATTSISVTLDVTPPELSLGSPSDGAITNNRNVLVSGITEPGATLTVDGAAVSVGPTGAFGTTVALADGPHVFTVIATDPAGNAVRATPSVTVDTVAPPITIATPTSGSTVTVPTVTVAGTTEPGARVVVNGYSVIASTSGAFSIRLALLSGANAITVTATDEAGNTGSDSVSVTYTDPVPGLRQQLNDTKSDLGTTNANLASLGTETLVLLVLLVASLALGAFQFVQIRKLGSEKGPRRAEGPTPPPPD